MTTNGTRKPWTEQELTAIAKQALTIAAMTSDGDAVSALYELTSRRHGIIGTHNPEVKASLRAIEDSELGNILRALNNEGAVGGLKKIAAARFGLDI